MSKVLQVDASAADAWVEADFSPVADFWVSCDLYVPAATLTAWTAYGNQWIFNVLLSDDTDADLVGTRLGNWRDGNGDTGGAVTADTWLACEFHHVTSDFGDFLVESASEFTPFDSGGSDAQKLRLGLASSGLTDPSLFYIRDVKIGTTQGAEDIFSDDFASGDLSAWDATSGDVSVIDDPIVPPDPTVPEAPTLDSATAGSGTVTLSWTPGDDGGADITGYRVYRGTSGAERLIKALGVVTTYVDDTAPGLSYYKVSALNTVGESLKSNELSATPTGLSIATAKGLVPGAFTTRRVVA